MLVTRDKLSCTGASISWVSNELQFADGMTKQSATSLLAQRLRNHVICLKLDPNFTISKKKILEHRKESQMRYAFTKPLTQMTIFASLATTTTAHSIELPDHNQDHLMDNQNLIFLADFTLMIAFLANLIWHLCTKATKKATKSSQSTTIDPQEEEDDQQGDE